MFSFVLNGFKQIGKGLQTFSIFPEERDYLLSNKTKQYGTLEEDFITVANDMRKVMGLPTYQKPKEKEKK